MNFYFYLFCAYNICLKNYATVFVDLCVPETPFHSLRLFLWERQSRIMRGNRKATQAQNSTALL